MTSTIPQMAKQSRETDPGCLVAFPSKIGWIGLLHRGYELLQIRIGFHARRDVFQEFRDHELGPKRPDETEKLWIEIFQNYGSGEPVSFDEFSICTLGMTPFQLRVVDACREIPFGETLSYGELAARSGSPNAARAVGTVMRKNRFPLVVPCHRVVASNGLGGFSAPDGTKLKMRLLEIEGIADQFRKPEPSGGKQHKKTLVTKL